MNTLTWQLTRLLPGPLRRTAQVALTSPHPRDGEYAAALLDDGRLDPAWRERHTERWTDPGSALPIGATALATLPAVVTPGALVTLRRMGGSKRLVAAAARRMPVDRARYPRLYQRQCQVDINRGLIDA